MTASTLGPALRHVHALYEHGTTAGLGDPDLLLRFAETRDEAAFEALVQRHGPMVLAAARAILREAGAAEDAFQATFLILSRRAGSIRDGEALAGWLHRVARRVAVRSLLDARGRAMHERQAGSARSSGLRSEDDPSAALHEEIDRLPDRYRLPVVLCHLEGLTHAEAARRLRRGERTVRRHLAEALPRLKDRLVGRGFGLSAAAVASLLAGESRANVPAAIASIAVRAASTGRAPAAVASLAKLGLRASVGLKGPIAAAAGLLASAFWLAGPILAGPGGLALDDGPKPAPTPPPVVEAQAPIAKEPGVWTYSGRVVDPEGRPFAGARLFIPTSIASEVPAAEPRAVSGADGRFRFTVSQKGYGVESGIVRLLHVIARGEGFGFGISEGDEPDADRELTVRLVRDDVPFSGRVLDLQGRPVVGARLRAIRIWSGDLSPWIKAAQLEGANGWNDREKSMPTRIDHDPGDPLAPTTVTGADGRFLLLGIGRDRLVGLQVGGPTVRFTEFEAVTRAVPPFLVPDPPIPSAGDPVTFRGANFDLILPPSRPIEGVVRDGETGLPIAGATVVDMKFADGNLVNTMRFRSVTDAEGRYRLEGLPKGAGNEIAILSPADQPYLPSWKAIGDSPGLNPERVDVALKRGIWARGKVRDKGSDKPVPATVVYHVAADNVRFAEVADFRAVQMDLLNIMFSTADDGTFRVAVLPGPGLLSLRTADGTHPLIELAPDRPEPFPEYAPRFRPGQAFLPINPAEGEAEVLRDFVLDPGRTVEGTILGLDGRPLPGTEVYGTDSIGGWDAPAATPGFAVHGLKPPGEETPQSRGIATLLFRNEPKRLATWRDVRHDDAGPIAVRLEPWAEATGRVVGPDGRPAANAVIRTYVPGKHRRGNGIIEHRNVPDRIDADGRFRLVGLAPGLAYQIQIDEGDRARWVKLAPIEPGNTFDLGEIQLGRD